MTKLLTETHPDELDIATGAAIRLRRKQLRISQEMLAERCGVTFQQVQKYENGANRVSFSRLVQIAHALGVRVADLVGDIDGDEGLSADETHALTRLGVSGAPELLEDYAQLTPALRNRASQRQSAALTPTPAAARGWIEATQERFQIRARSELLPPPAMMTVGIEFLGKAASAPPLQSRGR